MGNRTAKVQAKSSNGNELQIHQQETDSPILPVAQLERLQQLRPDLVDFVVAQTQAEAEHRRALEARGYWFTFLERMTGQICAVVVALSGMGEASIWACTIMNGWQAPLLQP